MTSRETKNGRMTLLLIAGIPVIMILASTWLWFYVASGKVDLVDMLGTANRGTLVSPPLALGELAVTDASGARFSATQSKEPIWRILIPLVQPCADACLETLHYTRQIHSAMGKYRVRIERLGLLVGVDEESPVAQQLGRDYPELQLLYTATAEFANSIALQRADEQVPAYYVVDPYGWLMLAYSASDGGKGVMADLKFLLKNSNG